MISDLRASWALLIGIGFMMLGNGLQGTLLGLRATLEGFPTFVTGIMMSGYYVGIFAGSLVAPRLVQRVGHIRVFAALASLASISILIHGLYVNAISWTAMRLITGLSYAGLFVVAESWLNDRASNETRGQVLSVYMVITTLGLGGGQFLLMLSDPLEVELFVLVSIIVSFGVIQKTCWPRLIEIASNWRWNTAVSPSPFRRFPAAFMAIPLTRRPGLQ